MSNLTLNIPENMWQDFGLAPKCGRIVYVKDSKDNVDLARHDDCGWTAEIGCCSDFVKFANVSICNI